MDNADKAYKNCTLCPNLCKTDRTRHFGLCRESNIMRLAWCGLHKGEEPPISGKKGSGMLFFCGCPLGCQYCQNKQISAYDRPNNVGIPVNEETLATLMLELQKEGAASVNFVTGTHFTPSIIKAIKIARKNGLKLKTVWNSSGYETPQTLAMLDPYIDLYLLDVKTLNCSTASKFCGKSKYAENIKDVVNFLKQHRHSTNLDNLNGVLVRHLVFPGEMQSTLDFLKYYAQEMRDFCMLSLMTQFVPPEAKKQDIPWFRPVSDTEYNALLDKLDEYMIDGFIQEREENEILWIPDFTKDLPFPENFAKTLPYFTDLKNSLV